MKIAHLILAHKGPEQLELLIRRLSFKDFHIYIHLDRKADINNFRHLCELENVFFIRKRLSVKWAGFSQVKAVVESLREILSTNIQYEYINTLSGQDYPLKSNEEIYSFFMNQTGKSFLFCEKEGSEWWQKAILRIEQYHTTDFSFIGQGRLEIILNSILPKRKLPFPQSPFTLYGGPGSLWWTLHKETVRYLIDFMDRHPRLRLFSLFTWGSDEFLIPTILMNSPFKDRIVQQNYRYMDWSSGAPNPKILTINDCRNLLNSNQLFARKFDIDYDRDILDRIDKNLHETGNYIQPG